MIEVLEWRMLKESLEFAILKLKYKNYWVNKDKIEPFL